MSDPPGRTGETPIATRAISASSALSAPFGVGDGDLHTFAVRLALGSLVIGQELMPCFVSDFSNACETSVSSMGKMLGSISMTVTFAPNALKM